jgi:hypothetical protein
MPDNDAYPRIDDGMSAMHEDDAEPEVTSLDGMGREPARALFSRRSRRVLVRRSMVATGLVLVALLAILLSMSSVRQAVSGSWRTVRQAVHPPALVVQSSVPWAEVWMDGREAGGVGQRIPLSLGAHTITVRATGFAPYTRRLSFGDTLGAAHGAFTISVPEHVLPGAVAQMAGAIDRELDATYGVDSVTTISPGETYAPERVARVPLRARLTVAMTTGRPTIACAPMDLSCQQRAANAIVNAYPCLSSTSGCISPYLTFLDSWGPNGRQALASIQVHLEVQFTTAATGQLVASTNVPTANYQGDEVILWPGSHGWQVSTAISTRDMLSGLQADAGNAQLQALLPPNILGAAAPVPPFIQTPLHPISEGMLFTVPFGQDVGATWLFHLGTLFAVDHLAHRLTPSLPLVPPALYPLVQPLLTGFLHIQIVPARNYSQ